MDIRLEVAFQEAMEEIATLNERIVIQRCMIKQLEEELEMLRNKNKEIEETMNNQK